MLLSRKRQEKVPFRSTHRSSTESVRTARICGRNSDSLVLEVDNKLDTDGSIRWNLSGRRLDAGATQPQTAGAGRVWVRSSDSKPIFTPNAGAVIEMDDIPLLSVLTRGADGDAQDMVNLLAWKASDGIGFLPSVTSGYEEPPAVTSVYIGTVDQGSIYAGQIVVGSVHDAIAPPYSVRADTVVVGLSQITFTGSSNQNGGVVLGTESSLSGHGVVIGHNSNGALTSANTRSGVLIGNDINMSAYSIASGATTIGTPLGGSGAVLCFGVDSVLIGCNAQALHPTAPANFVMVGSTSQAGNNSVAMGFGTAQPEPLTVTQSQNVIVGRNVTIENVNCVAVGSECSVQFDTAVALGSGALAVDGVNQISVGTGAGSGLAAANTVLIGANSAALATGLALGANVSATQVDEHATRGFHTAYNTITTTNATTDAVVLAVSTASNSAYSLAGSLIGLDTVNGSTYAFVFRDYHLRNKAGVVTLSGGALVSSRPDSPNVTANVAVLGTLVHFRVSDTATARAEKTYFDFDELTTGGQPGQYVTLSEPNAGTDYYLWFDNGVAADPAPPGRTGVAVAWDSNIIVQRDNLRTAINASIATITATAADEPKPGVYRVVATCDATGPALDIHPNGTAANVSVRVAQQGSATTSTINWVGVAEITRR